MSRITDAEIQAWLISRFDGTHPEFGTTPIAGGIYTLFYPPTTTIYLGNAPTPNDGGAEGGVPEGGTKGPRAQASCKAVMTGPMTVGIQSFGSGGGGGGGGGGDGGTAPKPPVSFALDKTTGVNGDKIKVTVTSNAATVSRLGATTFVITSKVGTESHDWAGVVGN